MFHVEPVARRQAGQGWISGVECGQDELRRDIADLLQQPAQVVFIELGRRIIHKQQRDL